MNVRQIIILNEENDHFTNYLRYKKETKNVSGKYTKVSTLSELIYNILIWNKIIECRFQCKQYDIQVESSKPYILLNIVRNIVKYMYTCLQLTAFLSNISVRADKPWYIYIMVNRLSVQFYS